jgi:hypothetical protein
MIVHVRFIDHLHDSSLDRPQYDSAATKNFLNESWVCRSATPTCQAPELTKPASDADFHVAY